MEGLIKGLIDVAIGGHHNDNDNDNDNDNPNRNRNEVNEDRDRQSRDERSRSTWAEVVSGDQDDEGERRHGYDQNQWNNQVVSGDEDDKSERRHGYSQNQWSHQVVTGNYDDGSERRHGYNQSQWNKQAVSEGYENYGESKQHHYNETAYTQEGNVENSDGWETVGRKPGRQHHQVHAEQWNAYKRPPSEQEYSDEVKIGDRIEPTEEELSDLSQACNRLWELDLNRLVPGKDYEIDCGEGKKVYQKGDMAEGSFFSWLSEDVFRRPTYSRFCSLLDNYNPHQGSKEVVTSEERQEQAAFIEEICRTAPIKYLHKYLTLKGIASKNYQEFKGMMTGLWFDLYGRGGTSNCSSAFEHVFVGEIKQQGEEEISGFHNWVQFYLEEAKGRVDYQGYIFPRRRGEVPDSETQLLNIQFEWNGVLKAVSSTLVGVSPEFEVALYTLCFFVGGEDNRVQLGPYPVNIKCYRLGDRIGSVFPTSEC